MRENTASVDSSGHIVSASSGAAPAGGEADGADPMNVSTRSNAAAAAAVEGNEASALPRGRGRPSSRSRFAPELLHLAGSLPPPSWQLPSRLPPPAQRLSHTLVPEL